MKKLIVLSLFLSAIMNHNHCMNNDTRIIYQHDETNSDYTRCRSHGEIFRYISRDGKYKILDCYKKWGNLYRTKLIENETNRCVDINTDQDDEKNNYYRMWLSKNGTPFTNHSFLIRLNETTLALFNVKKIFDLDQCLNLGAPKILFEYNSPIIEATLSPEGNYLITMHDNGSIILWDAHNGQLLHQAQKKIELRLDKYNMYGLMKNIHDHFLFCTESYLIIREKNRSHLYNLDHNNHNFLDHPTLSFFNDLGFSHNKRYLILRDDANIVIFDTFTHEEIAQINDSECHINACFFNKEDTILMLYGSNFHAPYTHIKDAHIKFINFENPNLIIEKIYQKQSLLGSYIFSYENPIFTFESTHSPDFESAHSPDMKAESIEHRWDLMQGIEIETIIKPIH